MHNKSQQIKQQLKIQSSGSMNFNFLCLDVGQRSEDEEMPHEVEQERRTVRPIKMRKPHKDLQQINGSRYIKTTFNQNNRQVKVDNKRRTVDKAQLEGSKFSRQSNVHTILHAIPAYKTINAQNYSSSVYRIGSSIVGHSPSNPPKTVSYTNVGNGQILICPYPQKHQGNDWNKPINQFTFGPMPSLGQFRADISRRTYPQVHKTAYTFMDKKISEQTNFVFPLSMKLQQTVINPLPAFNTESLFQPVMDNIRLFESTEKTLKPTIQPETQTLNLEQLLVREERPIEKKQAKDEDQEQPLKSKFLSQRQKAKSSISEEQIKKGFNNGFINALSKVSKVQKQAKQCSAASRIQESKKSQSIGIVSNLINESISPLKREMRESSIKRRKKPIFSTGIKNTSESRVNNVSKVVDYRAKPNSLYEGEDRSFETPQSMRMNHQAERDGVREFEMKTEKQRLFEQPEKDDRSEDEWQSQVPSHILNAWKRVNEQG